MYSRYVPGTDGCYEKRPVPSRPPKQPPHAPPPCPPDKSPPCTPPCPPPDRKQPPCPPGETRRLPGFLRKLLPEECEIGDLLVLLILLLLLIDGEEDDLSVLLAIGLFLFMK